MVLPRNDTSPTPFLQDLFEKVPVLAFATKYCHCQEFLRRMRTCFEKIPDHSLGLRYCILDCFAVGHTQKRVPKIPTFVQKLRQKHATTFLFKNILKRLCAFIFQRATNWTWRCWNCPKHILQKDSKCLNILDERPQTLKTFRWHS